MTKTYPERPFKVRDREATNSTALETTKNDEENQLKPEEPELLDDEILEKER